MIPFICDHDMYMEMWSDGNMHSGEIKGILCRLNECKECTAIEELNGEYYLELRYPQNGQYVEYLVQDNIVIAKPNYYDKVQPFIITKIDGKGTSDEIKIKAEHLAQYMYRKLVVLPYKTGYTTTAENLDKVKRRIVPNNYQKYVHLDSDISITKPYTLTNHTPHSLLDVIHGVDGSIIDTYGGEVKFDGLSAKIYGSRGEDSGYYVIYGRNLTKLSFGVSIEDRCDMFVCYWKTSDSGKETIHYLPANTTDINDDYKIGTKSRGEVAIYDVSDLVDDNGNVSIEKVKKTIKKENKGIWKDVLENLDIDFMDLRSASETSTYVDAPVKLGDRISVIYDAINMSIKEKIIKAKYDVIREIWKSFEVGSPKITLYDALTKIGSNATSKYKVVD